jgi:hypothetical protein
MVEQCHLLVGYYLKPESLEILHLSKPPTSAEKTARTETALRSFSPKDIADMDISGGGTASTVPWGGITNLPDAFKRKSKIPGIVN